MHRPKFWADAAQLWQGQRQRAGGSRRGLQFNITSRETLMHKLSATVAFLVFLALTAQAQGQNPFACQGQAEAESRGKSVGQIRQVISNKVQQPKSQSAEAQAMEYCVVAELMKRVGDYHAPDYYRKAIDAVEDNAVYHLFFAEYWRNFRGAQHSIFPRAEEQYFQGLSRLNLVSNQQARQAAAAQFERGLVALYQEDGVPLLSYTAENGSHPFLFFGTINNAARNTSDFDRRSEVRDFTSELVFSQSRDRLNRNLTDDEARRIIRTKDQFETFNRLRTRYRSGPVVDFTYKYRDLDGTQITNFFEPNKFNDVNLAEYGIAVEKPLATSAFDLFLRGSYKRARRVGIIEFFPRTKEVINQVETNAVISRFIGPDKANLEFTYVFQDIQENRPNQPRRDRSIYASKFTYQLFRPALQGVYRSRFETRGIDLFAGVLHDNETFGTVDVNRNDYYVGATLKSYRGVDFTVQPTVYTADVAGDPKQRHAQVRINATALYRIFDEEKQQGNPAFLHLVIPFSRDIATHGPETYENYKLGAALNTKLFTTGERRTTFLAGVGYSYQNFYKLSKGTHLYTVNFSIGF